MKLEIRYEDEMQVLELDTEDVDQMWITVGLEELPEGEKTDERLQREVDVMFNRPDYNNWHRHNRKDKFDPDPKVKRRDGKAGVLNPSEGGDDFNAMDYLAVTSDEETIEQDLEYEEICTWIREVLEKRPTWADAFISVYIDGMLIRDYAEREGIKENNANQRLWKAKRELRKAWQKKVLKNGKVRTPPTAK